MLSLPALSLSKGRSTLLMKREDQPPNPFVLSLSKHAGCGGRNVTFLSRHNPLKLTEHLCNRLHVSCHQSLIVRRG